MRSKLVAGLPLTVISLFSVLLGVNGAALQKRGAAVEFCTEVDLQGGCFVYLEITNGQCNNLPDNLNDDISSVHVQSGTVCVVWTDYDCSNNSHYIGSDVTSFYNTTFNDSISSFVCSSV